MTDAPDMLTPIAFWFLRHGETDWNAQGLSQGNVDIPLNETGLAQARSAALLLRNRGITSIISSPLSRAKVTADIAAKTLGFPVSVDEGLREVAFGVQEGKPMSEWFTAWVAGALTPAGRGKFSGSDAPGRCCHQPLHGSPAGGAGGGARGVVPGHAGRDGTGAERPHAQRRADVVRAVGAEPQRMVANIR